MKLYQPVFEDKNGVGIVDISTVVCKTRQEAESYGNFVCKRYEKLVVIELDVME